MVRSAYTLRADDDDFSQPGTLVRKVFNDEQRTKLAAIANPPPVAFVPSTQSDRAVS